MSYINRPKSEKTVNGTPAKIFCIILTTVYNLELKARLIYDAFMSYRQSLVLVEIPTSAVLKGTQPLILSDLVTISFGKKNIWGF